MFLNGKSFNWNIIEMNRMSEFVAFAVGECNLLGLFWNITIESCFPLIRPFDILSKSLFKACVRYFLSIFIFTPNDRPLKTMKNVFYFIEKDLFILKIFKFFWFFPFLSTLSRFKRANGSRIIIYDVMKWLA